MNAYNFSCQGESHKLVDKICQDYSYSDSDKNMSIAVVCDGHGGDRYFRSDVGARLAAEVTADAVKSFVADVDKSLFVGKPFAQEGTVATSTKEKQDTIDKSMRQLFSSIIFNWRNKIKEYSISNEVTDEERASVIKSAKKAAEVAGDAKVAEMEQKVLNAIDDFKAARKALVETDTDENDSVIMKTYGCTLMCYVQTSEFWFAFHQGDGKCVSLHDDDPIWKEPIPWDERCFLNKTTSICDSDAVESFRYCYQGDGRFPMAVFLGSDGLDDSFGPMDNLVNFYINVAKCLAKDSFDDAKRQIEETLPDLSRRGSKDDMSVACVFDSERLNANLLRMIDYQKSRIDAQISGIDKEISTRQLKKTTIDYIFTEKAIEQKKIEKDEVTDKYNQQITEINSAVDDLKKKIETLLPNIDEKEVEAIHDSYDKNEEEKLRIEYEMAKKEMARKEEEKAKAQKSIDNLEAEKSEVQKKKGFFSRLFGPFSK